ncbi:MAG: hypothetical protein OXU20_05510, partial [Myxococcales bacterium]|nr:hypothetical protein [Myxococcales bacterium]
MARTLFRISVVTLWLCLSAEAAGAQTPSDMPADRPQGDGSGEGVVPDAGAAGEGEAGADAQAASHPAASEPAAGARQGEAPLASLRGRIRVGLELTLADFAAVSMTEEGGGMASFDR